MKLVPETARAPGGNRSPGLGIRSADRRSEGLASPGSWRHTATGALPPNRRTRLGIGTKGTNRPSSRLQTDCPIPGPSPNDKKLHRVIALKLLKPEHVSQQDRRRRFFQEARAASALNHPHILTVYDVGEDDGKPYIAMEYDRPYKPRPCRPRPAALEFGNALWSVQESPSYRGNRVGRSLIQK